MKLGFLTAPKIWQFRIIYKSDIVNGKIKETSCFNLLTHIFNFFLDSIHTLTWKNTIPKTTAILTIFWSRICLQIPYGRRNSDSTVHLFIYSVIHILFGKAG